MTDWCQRPTKRLTAITMASAARSEAKEGRWHGKEWTRSCQETVSRTRG